MKRKIIKLLLMLVVTAVTGELALAQDKTGESRFRNTYYNTRRAAHDFEGIPSGSVIFLGNSITEQGWWNMLFKSKNIVNRGIGGDNTYGILDRLSDILASKPEKIFLMAGINDISLSIPLDTIVANIEKMVMMSKKMAPECKFYVQSVLPINETRLAYATVKGKNPTVDELNQKIKEMCVKEGIIYVDVARLFKDEKGELKLSLTKDGLHLHPEAYVMWANEFKRLKLLK